MIDLEKVKLVVWDLDGTLIDSFGVYRDILKEATTLSGLPMPDDETLRHNFHGSLDQTIQDTLKLVQGEAFEKVMNDFLKVQEDYYLEPESHIHKDALRLAERLSGRPQVVVTNRHHAGRGNASPHYLVEHSSLKKYITDVIPGDEAPVPKPDAGVLINIKVAQTVKGEEILVVGDQFVDALLAKNLGAQAVIVNRGDDEVPHLEQLGDDLSFLHIVASLDEVNALY